MSAKEKAIELVNKFKPHAYNGAVEENDELMELFHAKKCALITVDEIIKTLNEDIRDLDVRGNVLLDLIDYWREVKEEINNL